MSTHRAERVARQVIQAIAMIVEKDVGDPRLRTVTFTDVRMTPDLRNARVYFCLHGSEEDRKFASAGLASAAGYLRRSVARRLGLRYAPALVFEYDETIDQAERLDVLLEPLPQGDDPQGGNDD